MENKEITSTEDRLIGIVEWSVAAGLVVLVAMALVFPELMAPLFQ